MSEARDIIEQAQARADARSAGRVPTDYAALNRMVKRQRAALTRAVKSGQKGRVVVACRDAVREWDAPGAMWPDDWPIWQSALEEATGYRGIDLADL